MAANLIEAIFARQNEMLEYFSANGELTFASELEISGPKSLIFSAASAFEEEVIGCVRGAIATASNNHPAVVGLVESKALARQYHTLFDWDAKNVNRFISLFGEAFKSFASAALATDPLPSRAQAFLQVGSYRNQMVHQNYSTYNLGLTLSEARDLCLAADEFVVALPGLFADFVP